MPQYGIGRSYEYNVLCPVCGFKKDNTEMRQRWDGLMVCKDDWEPRNILDFYKPRNDTHLLPFILSDNGGTDVGPAIYSSTLTFVARQTAPAVPASGTSQANTFNRRIQVFVYGGTVTQITINSTATNETTGNFILESPDTITLTYSVAPSWVWYG